MGGGTIKNVFLCTGVGGGLVAEIAYVRFWKNRLWMYIDNQRVVASLSIISKTYSKH